MGELASCVFSDLALMGLIIGSVIVSIGYSFYKNNKSFLEKEIIASR